MALHLTIAGGRALRALPLALAGECLYVGRSRGANMIPLDSPRWSDLRHAYGRAGDVPDMLRRLGTPEEESAWEDLFGAVVHQGSSSSSAHAAVPHILELAEKADPRVASEKHLFFIGMVARSLDSVESPPDVHAEYLAALERARPLALASLRRATTLVDAIYGVQLVASLEGRTTLAHVIERLADQGAECSCPACRAWILVEEEQPGIWSASPGEGPRGHSTILAPRPLPLAADLSDLAWAAALLQHVEPRDELLAGLSILNALCVCPVCDHAFALYDDALSLLE